MTSIDKDGVVRFDASLVKKLQLDLLAARNERVEIVEGSRLYWQRVQAVHSSILLLYDVKSIEEAAALLQEDIARLLGVDFITLLYERLSNDGIGGDAMFFKNIPSFLVNAAFEKTEYHIVEDRAQLDMLFPEQSSLLAFAICLPIKTGKRRGVIMMARREVQNLSASHALEPYVFFARCVERMGQVWLP